MKDERKTKDGRLIRVRLSIFGRPYPKYLRRRGEKKTKRSMLSEGYRDEIAARLKSLARSASFNKKVRIVCHFYLAKGDGGSGFDGKNLFANAEDAAVDSGIVIDDNCKRVRGGVFYVDEYGEYKGESRTDIAIEEMVMSK